MSQFDFGNLESPLSGTVFINGNLEPWRDALHSSHKGGSRPSYAVEGMMWVNDTTNPWVLNMFDGSNDIALGSFDTTTNTFTPSGVSQAAEDISFDNTDSGLTATNVQDAIDEAVSDFSDFEGRADGFATSTQGAKADTALQPNGNGSALTGVAKINLGTPQTTTSGTLKDFTIPAGAVRFEIPIFNLSTSGSSTPIIQLGDSGGIETTGYLGGAFNGGGTGLNFTTGLGLGSAWGAGTTIHGTVIGTLLDPATNLWTMIFVGGFSNSVGGAFGGASKALSAVLTTIRITTVGGVDTFDLGQLNVQITY